MKIRLENISLGFHGRLFFENFSLGFETPAVILGGAGAGKSNLCRILAGTAPIDDGLVVLGDEDVSFSPPKARDISLICAATPLSRKTVRENLLYPLKIRGIKGVEAESRLPSELATLWERKTGELDDSQRAAVYYYRALIKGPRLLIVDGAEEFLREGGAAALIGLLKNCPVPYIYMTGDADAAAELSVETVILRRGLIAAHGAYRTLTENPGGAYTAAMLGLNVIDNRALSAEALGEKGDVTIAGYLVEYRRAENGFALYLTGRGGPFKALSASAPLSRELTFYYNSDDAVPLCSVSSADSCS